MVNLSDSEKKKPIGAQLCKEAHHSQWWGKEEGG